MHRLLIRFAARLGAGLPSRRHLILHEHSALIEELDENRLPPGDVEIAVAYSSLNYKDGLVLNGLGGLVKT